MTKEDFVDILKTTMHVLSAQALHAVLCMGDDPDAQQDKLNAQLFAVCEVYELSDIGNDGTRKDLREEARCVMYHYEKDSRTEG